MRPLKSLTLEAIVELLATTFGELEDPRAADQLTYPLHDPLMSGFALMFFPHPSLLPFQRALQQKRRRCHLQTIFGVPEVPSDTQMREIRDGVEPEPLRALLPQLCEKVRRAGWGSRCTTTRPSGQHQGTYYTVALEGSEYCPSTKVQCPHCLRQPDAKGQVHYSHLGVGATLGQAGSHQGVPVDAEAVRNPTAESHPQDCELTAGKRRIARLRREHRQMALIVIGEDLYSHVPFVEQLQPLRLPYVLVAKPDSHPTLMATVAAAEAHGVSQPGQWEEGSGTRRRIYTYRIVRQAPLAAENPVPVTFVEVGEHAAGGELLYHNSWITDLDVTAENVAGVVRIGRTRWKIEHEQLNVQKNHGDELTHTYGHGQHGLSRVFYLLNLLAYVAHVSVELGDRLYQRCRARESRRELGAALRTRLHAVLVASWAQRLLGDWEEEATGP